MANLYGSQIWKDQFPDREGEEEKDAATRFMCSEPTLPTEPPEKGSFLAMLLGLCSGSQVENNT
jgi:hypothetical protein